MTKVKEEKAIKEDAGATETGVTEKSYLELIANMNPIANPLATKKLSKKLYKCVKKGNLTSHIGFMYLLPNTC